MVDGERGGRTPVLVGLLAAEAVAVAVTLGAGAGPDADGGLVVLSGVRAAVPAVLAVLVATGRPGARAATAMLGLLAAGQLLVTSAFLARGLEADAGLWVRQLPALLAAVAGTVVVAGWQDHGPPTRAGRGRVALVAVAVSALAAAATVVRTTVVGVGADRRLGEGLALELLPLAVAAVLGVVVATGWRDRPHARGGVAGVAVALLLDAATGLLLARSLPFVPAAPVVTAVAAVVLLALPVGRVRTDPPAAAGGGAQASSSSA